MKTMRMIPAAKVILIVVASAALGLSAAHASVIVRGPVRPAAPVSVPDSGSTAALLGLALVGVAFLRRRFTRG